MEEKRKALGLAPKMAAMIVAVGMLGTSFGYGIGAGAKAFLNKGGEKADIVISMDDDTRGGSNYIPVSAAGAALSSVSDVYKKAKDSVVSVNMLAEKTNFFSFSQDVSGAGSGIIFSEDEKKVYIVTNYHVVASAYSVTVSIDDEVVVPAHAVGGDSKADIAVIYVNKSDLVDVDYTVADFADSDIIEVGDAVIAIGNALGEGKSVTFGVISTGIKEIIIDNTKLSVMQTDAAINPGNSGGALVNMNGEVIGVNSAKVGSSGVEGMGYAIPINVVREIVNKIMTDGAVERPYLGIASIEIDDIKREYYGLAATGVYVSGIEAGSTAEDADVRKGDIITEINGVEIKTNEELADAVKSIKVGELVSMTVVREVYSGRRMWVESSVETLVLNAGMKQYKSALNF